MSKKNVIFYSDSIGFLELLTAIFIVLKLCNVISWSWVWVLSPIWIPIAFVMILFIILGTLSLILKY